MNYVFIDTLKRTGSVCVVVNTPSGDWMSVTVVLRSSDLTLAAKRSKVKVFEEVYYSLKINILTIFISDTKNLDTSLISHSYGSFDSSLLLLMLIISTSPTPIAIATKLTFDFPESRLNTVVVGTMSRTTPLFASWYIIKGVNSFLSGSANTVPLDVPTKHSG